MKQLLQNMRSGQTIVAEVPCPSVRPGMVLIRTATSLVSAGTERMLVEFAEKSLLGKARSRPDLVRQVLDKARREGLLPTITAAFNRLDQPMPLGYSSAGTVLAVGAGVEGIQPGDRLACAGGGYAVHAEYAVVPKNLVAVLPETVDFESAAFATLGAIALHGFRLAQPQVGERVAVIGMGLLGLLAAGIARAAGCQVFGVDVSAARLELAQQMGFTAAARRTAEAQGAAFTHAQGFDCVLICADTRTSDPVALAARLARDRARIVAVGAVGLDLPRKSYYDKELTFLVSRSYGPGRYDPAYEEGGQDYPIGFVRWTEGRNLQAVVDLLASGALDIHPLISHRFPIEQAPAAYELITGKRRESFLGVLLTYSSSADSAVIARRLDFPGPTTAPINERALGVLGAGNYATAVFLPGVVKTGGIARTGIASASGLSASHAARRFGFTYATSDEEAIIDDPNIGVIAILTRHQHHTRQALAALQRGKAVYCEKPLAITPQELAEITAFLAQNPDSRLTVGFNRRFAPFGARLQDFFASRSEPLAAHYTINAGFLPLSHWLHDPAQGGGRIIGEGCHFIDFLTFLVGEPPVEADARALPELGKYRQDNVLLTLRFRDGSLGTLAYLANGDKSYPKERVEVFCGGNVGVLDDFRRLELVQDGRREVLRSRFSQDKGHRASWEAFLTWVSRGGKPTIPFDHLLGVTAATFAAVEALHTGKPQPVQYVGK
ncbi:MAG TPA: bi-domain-containing oxidoreductase [Anaerolineaceae bacterium]